MKHESTDLRVRRTLHSIKKSFYELILERPFRSISITELTTRAGINRKTFYLHYKSMKELVEEIQNEIVNEIVHKFMELPEEQITATICIDVFYRYLYEGDEIHKKLLCDDEYRFFYDGMMNALLDDEFLLSLYKNTEHPTIVRAYFSAITSIYRAWDKDPGGLSLEQLIDYACMLMIEGFKSVRK